jgi:hypothetical protein
MPGLMCHLANWVGDNWVGRWLALRKPANVVWTTRIPKGQRPPDKCRGMAEFRGKAGPSARLLTFELLIDDVHGADLNELWKKRSRGSCWMDVLHGK